MNIYEIILISISISMLLYYIYETNVVWEYLNKISSLIKLKFLENFFYGTLLLKVYQKSNEHNYLTFINNKYNTFTTRLLSCPICGGFWISIFFGICYEIKFSFIYAFLSLVLYFFLKILTKFSSKI